jgi:hypothetical protein
VAAFSLLHRWWAQAAIFGVDASILAVEHVGATKWWWIEDN